MFGTTNRPLVREILPQFHPRAERSQGSIENVRKQNKKLHQSERKSNQRKALPKEKCFPAINGLEQLRHKY